MKRALQPHRLRYFCDKVSTLTISFTKSLGLLLLFSFILSEASAKSKIQRASVRDMVLIYSGGDHRKTDWNPQQLSNYVAIDSLDNATQPQWLFDGYLFLEIFWTKEKGLATGYRSRGACKEDWVALIDKYLSPNRDIAALNTAVGNYRKKIKGKFERRKVVISIPEPIYGQTDWGELNGHQLDFNNDTDRRLACEWYIDLIMARFKEAGFDNLQLCGFYWLAEHDKETRTFVHTVSDYIHSKKLDFYWIPYFRAKGFQDWKSLGFDQAYLQPNHFFNEKIPDSRIDETCKLAKQYGLSLEMEFDERAIQSTGWGYRLKAYIDSYERNGIFQTNPIAYYQGDNAFYKLKYGAPADRELFLRLARIIAKRQHELK